MNGIEWVDRQLFEIDSGSHRIRRCLVVVVDRDKEEEDPQPCRLSWKATHTIILQHHMIKIFFVINRDQSIEIFTKELILEANIGKHECGKLCHEVGEVDITIGGDDFVVAADVGIMTMIMKSSKPRLEFSTIGNHEDDSLIIGRWVLHRLKVFWEGKESDKSVWGKSYETGCDVLFCNYVSCEIFKFICISLTEFPKY